MYSDEFREIARRMTVVISGERMKLYEHIEREELLAEMLDEVAIGNDSFPAPRSRAQKRFKPTAPRKNRTPRRNEIERRRMRRNAMFFRQMS